MHHYLGTFGRINCNSGKNNKYNPHIVKPIEIGIDKLSSAIPKETFSIMAPINAAKIPIKYSEANPSIFGVNKTTMLALMKKAKVPSRLFLRNLWRPNLRPINAASESLTIRIENAVMKNIFGKIITQIKADNNTYVAPFRFFLRVSTSCFLSKKPNSE